jgi:hypothetical protein
MLQERKGVYACCRKKSVSRKMTLLYVGVRGYTK